MIIYITINKNNMISKHFKAYIFILKDVFKIYDINFQHVNVTLYCDIKLTFKPISLEYIRYFKNCIKDE